jgi:hypothetical protein
MQAQEASKMTHDLFSKIEAVEFLVKHCGISRKLGDDFIISMMRKGKIIGIGYFDHQRWHRRITIPEAGIGVDFHNNPLVNLEGVKVIDGDLSFIGEIIPARAH